MAGQMAVRYAVDGRTDQMVVLVRETGTEYRCTTDSAPLTAIANAEKRFPAEFLTAERNFVTPAFVEYATPLIGGPLRDYARLAKSPLVS